MRKLKKALSDPQTWCRVLYSIALAHLVMGVLHMRETPTWWLPSHMPAEFTSRQIVAEIWTLGLLILGMLGLVLALLVSFTVRITRLITAVIAAALPEETSDDRPL